MGSLWLCERVGRPCGQQPPPLLGGTHALVTRTLCASPPVAQPRSHPVAAPLRPMAFTNSSAFPPLGGAAPAAAAAAPPAPAGEQGGPARERGVVSSVKESFGFIKCVRAESGAAGHQGCLSSARLRAAHALGAVVQVPGPPGPALLPRHGDNAARRNHVSPPAGGGSVTGR